MAQYTVEFYRTVTERACISVDCAHDEAENVARDLCDDADWIVVQTGDPVVEDVVLEQ
jgi:hypothetical protein